MKRLERPLLAGLLGILWLASGAVDSCWATTTTSTRSAITRFYAAARTGSQQLHFTSTTHALFPDYSRIMLYAFADRLFRKLCQHIRCISNHLQDLIPYVWMSDLLWWLETEIKFTLLNFKWVNYCGVSLIPYSAKFLRVYIFANSDFWKFRWNIFVNSLHAHTARRVSKIFIEIFSWTVEICEIKRPAKI